MNLRKALHGGSVYEENSLQNAKIYGDSLSIPHKAMHIQMYNVKMTDIVTVKAAS